MVRFPRLLTSQVNLSREECREAGWLPSGGVSRAGSCLWPVPSSAEGRHGQRRWSGEHGKSRTLICDVHEEGEKSPV